MTSECIRVFSLNSINTHSVIVEAKELEPKTARDGLASASQRLEAAASELRRRVYGGDLQGMQDLNYAIASLAIQQKTVVKVPTWPWRLKTVRLVVTALILPLLL
ncbi:MAG TPA: hypothetical protein VMW79_08700 [Anaerolineae bacterium]|nr:hypothetical protein [Anaerolineae bacterium]